MKLTALSDVHGSNVELFDPLGSDICLIAGDIAPCKAINDFEKARQVKWMKEKFCPYLASHHKTEFVFVAGNHDFWGEQCTGREDWWPTNAHYLKNNSIIMFDGLLIWGSPIVNPIGSYRRWAFETSENAQEKIFAEMPKATKIVLTHTPPMIEGSMIDVPSGAIDIETGEPLHLGSVALTDAVRRVNPKYLFCGHIHSGDHHEQNVGETRCFNVSLLDEGYEYSYYPLQIEI